MKITILLLKTIITAFLLHATTSYAQVRINATLGTTGPSSYTTVNNAFTAINAGTHKGVIRITVSANTTEPANPVQLLSSGTGSSSYQSIYIVPEGNVVIRSAATPAASRAVLEFIGADSITVDGDDPLTPGARNLTVEVALTTNVSTACMRFSSSAGTGNGCKYATIKNCIIKGGRNSPVSDVESFGIYSGQSSASALIDLYAGAADNDSMLIENNEINRCYVAILGLGLSNYYQDFLRIRNNIIGSPIRADNIGSHGIKLAYTQKTAGVNAALIENNDIQAGDSLNSYQATVHGIVLIHGTSGTIIRNNNIHDISCLQWGSMAINILGPIETDSIQIVNNFIRDIRAPRRSVSHGDPFVNYGIWVIDAVTNLKINHNTIAFNKPNFGGLPINNSSCIYFSSADATVSEFRNNIIVNRQDLGGTSIVLGLKSVNTIAGAIMNGNCYWGLGSAWFKIDNSLSHNLSQFKRVTGKERTSILYLPGFVSSTDLHLLTTAPSPLESAGDTTYLVTDYDGDPRPGPNGSVRGGATAPDIGADEADLFRIRLSQVLTLADSAVTATTATLKGSIINNGNGTITSSGMVYSKNPITDPVMAIVSTVATNPVVVNGDYTVSATGLTHSTKYYYRAFVTNEAGTAYGTQDSFTTALLINMFPYTQNFESGNGEWKETIISGPPTWFLGTPSKTYLNGAKSGTNAWTTKLSGNYSDSANSSLESPQISFAGIGDPVLRFTHKFVSQPDNDALIVEMSIDKGSWIKVNNVLGTGPNFNTANGYLWYNSNSPAGLLNLQPKFSGNDTANRSSLIYSNHDNGWIESAALLTGAANKTDVRVRFRFASDSVITHEGWAIDDIALEDFRAPFMQANNMVVSASNTTASLTWNNGNGQSRIIVARLTSKARVAPANFKAYSPGGYGLGDSTGTGNFVVYNGTGNSALVTGLSPLVGYTFDLYEYNGKQNLIKYINAPVSSNTTTTPVKWLNFTAGSKGGSAVLFWSTLSE
ncbi:MAG: hypothetical protein V4658_05295, partial [Bacteroidota bacterium]